MNDTRAALPMDSPDRPGRSGAVRVGLAGVDYRSSASAGRTERFSAAER